MPKAVPAGVRARCISLVQRIKKHPAFTDSIGHDLDIMATEPSLDQTAYKGRITGATVTGPSEVTIEFFKGHSSIQGVNAYSPVRRATDWTKLAFDSQSPYIDTTPLAVAGKPDVREYRVRAVGADEEIGAFSDIATVTVS